MPFDFSDIFCIGGNNSDGIHAGADAGGNALIANMFFLRPNDVLRDTAISGFTTGAADARLDDDYMSAWAPYMRQGGRPPGPRGPRGVAPGPPA